MLKSLFQKISPALIVKEAKAPAHEASEHEQRLAEVCACPAAEALHQLGTTERGLGADDVAAQVPNDCPHLASPPRAPFAFNQLEALSHV